MVARVSCKAAISPRRLVLQLVKPRARNNEAALKRLRDVDDDDYFTDYASDADGGSDFDGELMPAIPWSWSDSDGHEDPRGMSLEELEEHFEALNTSLAPEEVNQEEVVLLEGVWDSLPEEILWNILLRLPVANQCRLRCVCSRWKLLLSAPSSSTGQCVSPVESRPLCTVMSEIGCSRSMFFSHAERKWYRIPFRPDSYLDVQWTLRATDGGLLCYETYLDGISWLLICNPMNGSSQLLPPDYPSPAEPWVSRIVNFAVDLKTGSFRIVLMHNTATMIFNSRSQGWKVFERKPATGWGEGELVWKNVIYARTRQHGTYLTFDMESGVWSTMVGAVPGDPDRWCHLVGSQDQVILLQFDLRHEHFIRIWRLLHAKDAPTLSLSKWEEVAVEIPDFLMPVVKQIQRWWLYGNEFICFATCWTHHWIKYIFKSKTWHVMPHCGRSKPLPYYPDPGLYEWWNWEPRVDICVESIDFNTSDYPELLGPRGEQSLFLRGNASNEFHVADEIMGADQSNPSDGSYDSDGSFSYDG